MNNQETEMKEEMNKEFELEEINEIENPRSKKILMLAWRDMKHPLKGGAEVVTDIYLSGLAKKGHDVTLFSSAFKGCQPTENFNGYKIIRKGNKLSVYAKGLLYARKHQKDFDVIIDQVNTIPFFTPLLIKKSKRVAYFNQLCLNVWFYETPFPIALFGNLAERVYVKLYKNNKFLTISESTKNDLIKYCWAKPENIFISEMQIDFKPIDSVGKKKNQFVFCARLVKSKRTQEAIKALALVKNKETKLLIIGDGPYKQNLIKLTKKLNLTDRVVFTGRLSMQERNNIMAESLAILVTSVREGWGLIVTEANANGTPAITYDIEGLRDANKSGIVTPLNTPKALAESMDNLQNNKILMIKLSKDAIASAKQHHSNWTKQVEELEKWLVK